MTTRKTAYRPTPKNPNVPADRPSTAAATVDDIDELLKDIDAILEQEEAFAVNFRQLGGQ